MQRLRVLIAVSVGAVAAAAIAGLPAGQARVEPGTPFPPLKLQALRPGATGASPLDLAGALGKKPVLICYIALGEPLGEEALTVLQERTAGEWKGAVEVLGAVRLSGGSTPGQARERLSLLGVDLPVVMDDSFALGTALGVTTSPSFSLVDRTGTLRIADARSLRQELPEGGTLEQAVGAAARGGSVPTVLKMPRYYPAGELVGEPAPDFILQQFQGRERLKLSDRLAAGQGKKMVALLFWHPNCKHCKQAMPGIMAGWRAYQQYIDLFSVVALKNEDEVVNARDTIRAHGMTFPVLQDEGRRVTELYKVVSTPTMFFVRPDGRVESVYTKGDVNYVPVFSAKLRSILGVASQLSGSRPKSKSP
jgi:peroxiredoxin